MKDDNAKIIPETREDEKTVREDFVTNSIKTEVNQKTIKSVIESNNVDNDHKEDRDMNCSKTSNEGHTGQDVSPKTDENHGKIATDRLNQHKLNQNENKDNVVEKIETEDFNSNNVKVTVNIPNNEQCDICGQFVHNSDIIYYQGHPQDAVEEFIALTNDKLVLSAGKYYFCLLSFLSQTMTLIHAVCLICR